mgnify:FL=1
MRDATVNELVHYRVADGVATITLDSPGNRNALGTQLVGELLAAIQRADDDDEARVVLIESSGKVFCSGADLSEAATVGMEEGARRIVALQRLVAGLSKPVVTKNVGAVRAGGIGLVAAADVALSAADATFALTEVKLGLAPAAISLTVLHRMHSRAAALTVLGGEVFSGAEAAAYGLVTTAVPAEELDAEVARVCASLASGTRQGLREAKRILNADLLASIDAKGAQVASLSARLFASAEAGEAMSAFLARSKS